MSTFQRIVLMWIACSSSAFAANDVADDLATFTSEGQLVRPANYREWVLIGTGLSMAYGPVLDKLPAGERPFTNVFVNPSSYRAFCRPAGGRTEPFSYSRFAGRWR